MIPKLTNLSAEPDVSPLETRFEKLRDLAEIQALVGQTEDLHLDAKEWPARDDDAQRILAKALSGFSNADGGILVIGLEARSVNSKRQRKPSVPEVDLVLK